LILKNASTHHVAKPPLDGISIPTNVLAIFLDVAVVFGIRASDIDIKLLPSLEINNPIKVVFRLVSMSCSEREIEETYQLSF
jgi:hypothetical protein